MPPTFPNQLPCQSIGILSFLVFFHNCILLHCVCIVVYLMSHDSAFKQLLIFAQKYCCGKPVWYGYPYITNDSRMSAWSRACCTNSTLQVYADETLSNSPSFSLWLMPLSSPPTRKKSVCFPTIYRQNTVKFFILNIL